MKNSAAKIKAKTKLAQLLEENASLRKHNQNLLEEVEYQKELIRHLKRLRFSPSSEKFPFGQKTLFDEAETIPATEVENGEEASTPNPRPAKKRGRPIRKPLPEHLPREDKIIDIPESEKICPKSGKPLNKIGEEVLEQLEIEPLKAKVTRIVRPKYAPCDCPECRTAGNDLQNGEGATPQKFKVAPPPPQPIPKSIASPSLLSYIITGKYADALPLHRQEGIFKRSQIDISRATMANWIIKCGDLVIPLINLAWDELRKLAIIQSDETPIQILKRSGKSATSDSYMWVFMNGQRDGPKIVLYELGPSRSHTVPLRYLEEYQGYLQTDGYEGYGALAKKATKIILVADWVHVRRKFDEAIKALPKDFKGEIKVMGAFKLINELFRIEREDVGENCNCDDIRKIRLEKSKPVVDALKKWLDDYGHTIPPKSLSGIAISYLRDQWSKLLHFLHEPRLRLDTNPVEGAIRPFVIGRNNWLFSDTEKGAEASAALYSLVVMARLNDLNPFDYLKAVLTDLPKAKAISDYEALLPWIWKPAAA